MNIVLASSSPRRKELLEQIGIKPIIIPAEVDESSLAADSAEELVEVLAEAKAQWVFAKLDKSNYSSPGFVLGADTVVVLDGQVLGKPVDAENAKNMLRTLSGKTHHVITGVCLISIPQGKIDTWHEVTKVTFRPLSDAEIAAYVMTGEPMDKAGAYGIQGKGALLVEKIDGCYNNVVGLPLGRLGEKLAEMGVNLWETFGRSETVVK